MSKIDYYAGIFSVGLASAVMRNAIVKRNLKNKELTNYLKENHIITGELYLYVLLDLIREFKDDKKTLNKILSYRFKYFK